MSKTIVSLLIAICLLALVLLSPGTAVVRYVAALFPILLVLTLMTVFHWNGQKAGPLGWLAGVVVAALVFGLTFDVFWVSQAKGLVTSGLVLGVLWPALLLYNLVNKAGGIDALARALQQVIPDYGLLLIVLSWAFSGLLEGLAGYGIPIAIVAPMLVSLRVKPVRAVAAVAVGHAWAVTFGDMGVIFQTLIRVVHTDPASVASLAALLLGVCCLACGLAVTRILGLRGNLRAVAILALTMSVTQYGLAVSGITPLAALLAGFSGIIVGIVLAQIRCLPQPFRLFARHGQPFRNAGIRQTKAVDLPRPLIATLISYGTLTGLLASIVLIQPLGALLNQAALPLVFPQVTTLQGTFAVAESEQVIRPFVHPGAAILLIALLSYGFYRRSGLLAPGDWNAAFHKTCGAALPASIGIIAMVGLSAVMEHTGMTQLLAQALSQMFGGRFPVVSPLVGMLGAFATGSNNNSNVLLAPLQESAGILLGIAPAVLVAAQTSGGAIGSMIAPAKIIVGCSTVGLRNRDGEVLRITVPYGLLIGVAIGLIAFILTLA